MISLSDLISNINFYDTNFEQNIAQIIKEMQFYFIFSFYSYFGLILHKYL
jgi:hypothetical protein